MAWISTCETLLGSISGTGSFASFLASLEAKQGGNGPCTLVWTAGTVAYRCRTCQMSPSSAICVQCFKSGNHEGHDYVMYRSAAGGCCDCGDTSSWAASGCCPAHTPSQDEAPLQDVAGPKERAVLQLCVTLGLRELAVHLAAASQSSSRTARDQSARKAKELCEWLSRLAAVAPLRRMCCACMCEPALAPQVLHTEQWQGSQEGRRGQLSAGGPAGGAQAGDSVMVTAASGSSTAAVNSSTSVTGRYDGVLLSTGELEAAFSTLRHHCLFSAVSQMVVAVMHAQQDLARDTALASAARQRGKEDTLAFRVFHVMANQEAGVLQDLTTLLLLLLYDNDFKYATTVHLMGMYQDLLGAVIRGVDDRHPLAVALDRLTVQLFNSEQVTLRLLHDVNLLESMHGILSYVLTQALEMVNGPRPHHMAPNAEQELSKRVQALYGCLRRVLGDLNTIIHHPVALDHLLKLTVFSEGLLGCLERMQCMCPCVRLLEGSEALPELSPLSTAAAYCEVVFAGTVDEMVTTAEGSRPLAAATTPGQQVEWLAKAALSCFEVLSDWSNQQLYLTSTRTSLPPQPPAQGTAPNQTQSIGLVDAASVWRGLLEAQLPVSVHLPLHRAAAKFLQGLMNKEAQLLRARESLLQPVAEEEMGVMMDLTAEAADLDTACATARQGVEALKALLFCPCDPPVCAGSSGQGTSGSTQDAAGASGSGAVMYTWQAVLRHILMVQCLQIQVRQRMWVRNGDEVDYALMYLLNYRDITQDLDHLLTLFTLAAAPQYRKAEVLVEILSGLGAGPLVQAAGVFTSATAGTSAATSTPAANSSGPVTGMQEAALKAAGALELSYRPGRLAAAESSLRHLLLLLRDRTLCGLPPRERLKQELVHWLALRDSGFNQLLELLPSDLQQDTHSVEEVLSEIATFKAPSMAGSGSYTLRREAWDQWDPSFLHYSPRAVTRAWENAALAGYKPHWQLRPPRLPLPPSLEPSRGVLATVQLYRIVLWVMQSCRPPSPQHESEELLLYALNLLALQAEYTDELIRKRSPEAAAAAATYAAAIIGPTGALTCLSGLLLQTEGARGPPAAAAAATREKAGLALGNDAKDCCTYLIKRCQEVLATAQAANLAPMTTTGATTTSSIPGTAAASEGGAGVTSPSNTAAVGAAVAGGTELLAAAGGGSSGDNVSEADQARQRAKARQAEMMERMRAQQAAFLAHKTQQEGSSSPRSRGRHGGRSTGPSPLASPTPGAGSYGASLGAMALDDSSDEGDKSDEESDESDEDEEMQTMMTSSYPQGGTHSQHAQRAQQEQPAGPRQLGSGTGASSGRGMVDAAAASSSEVEEDEDREEEDDHMQEEGDGMERAACLQQRRGAWRGQPMSVSVPSHQDVAMEVAESAGPSPSPSPALADTQQPPFALTPREGGQHHHHAHHRHNRSAPASTRGAAPQTPAAAPATPAPPVASRVSLGWLEALDGECCICHRGPPRTRTRLQQLGPLGWVAHASPCGLMSATTPDADTTPALTFPHQQHLQQQIDEGTLGPESAPNAAHLQWARCVASQGPLASSAVEQGIGLHFHACGHMMHKACYSRHSDTVRTSVRESPSSYGNHLLSAEAGDFLCPGCRRLANCLLPATSFHWNPAPTPATTTAAAQAPSDPAAVGQVAQPASNPIHSTAATLPGRHRSSSSGGGEPPASAAHPRQGLTPGSAHAAGAAVGRPAHHHHFQELPQEFWEDGEGGGGSGGASPDELSSLLGMYREAVEEMGAQVSTIAQYVLERLRRVQDTTVFTQLTTPPGTNSITGISSHTGDRAAAMQVDTHLLTGPGQPTGPAGTGQQQQGDAVRAAQLLEELVALAHAADSQAVPAGRSPPAVGAPGPSTLHFHAGTSSSHAGYFDGDSLGDISSSTTSVHFVGTTIRRVRQYYKDADPLGLQPAPSSSNGTSSSLHRGLAVARTLWGAFAHSLSHYELQRRPVACSQILSEALLSCNGAGGDSARLQGGSSAAGASRPASRTRGGAVGSSLRGAHHSEGQLAPAAAVAGQGGNGGAAGGGSALEATHSRRRSLPAHLLTSPPASAAGAASQPGSPLAPAATIAAAVLGGSPQAGDVMQLQQCQHLQEEDSTLVHTGQQAQPQAANFVCGSCAVHTQHLAGRVQQALSQQATVTGLPAVESAQWRATCALASLCCAMGTGDKDPHAPWYSPHTSTWGSLTGHSSTAGRHTTQGDDSKHYSPDPAAVAARRRGQQARLARVLHWLSGGSSDPVLGNGSFAAASSGQHPAGLEPSPSGASAPSASTAQAALPATAEAVPLDLGQYGQIPRYRSHSSDLALMWHLQRSTATPASSNARSARASLDQSHAPSRLSLGQRPAGMGGAAALGSPATAATETAAPHQPQQPQQRTGGLLAAIAARVGLAPAAAAAPAPAANAAAAGNTAPTDGAATGGGRHSDTFAQPWRNSLGAGDGGRVSAGRGSTGSSWRERALGEGPEVLLYLDLSTWCTAVADPLVLTLELWALALSCCAAVTGHQNPQQQQQQQKQQHISAAIGASGPHTSSGHVGGSRAHSSSGAAAELAGLTMVPQLCSVYQQHQEQPSSAHSQAHAPTTAGQVLASVFSHVLPVAACQAAVWAVTAGPLTAVAAAAAANMLQAQQHSQLPRLVQVLCLWCGPDRTAAVSRETTLDGSTASQQMSERQQGGQQCGLLLGHVSAQLLPLLVKVYVAQCAAEGVSPKEDLMKRYAALVPIQLPDVVQPVQLRGAGTTMGATDPGSAAFGAPGGSTEAAAEVSQALNALADDLCAALGVQSIAQALASTFTAPVSPPAASTLAARASRWCGPLLSALRVARQAGTEEQQQQQQGSSRALAAHRARPTWRDSTGRGCVADGLLLGPGLPVPASLIPLPPLFQDLYLQLANQPCLYCGQVPESPSLCLVTGRLLCSWWRGACGNGRGSGVRHALQACGGTTLFLSLRSTKVIALGLTRFAVCQSPYLDAHGEEDTDMKRGRPLYLNTNAYAQLSRMWAAQALEFDTQVLASSRADVELL